MSKFKLPIFFKAQKTLGPLELSVMQIIWEKEECTVRDVMENLRQKKAMAYTTIMTVMENLYQKGFVKRIKLKKTYHYKPLAPRNLFIHLSASKVLESLTSEYGKSTIFLALIPQPIYISIFKLNPFLTLHKASLITGFLASFLLGLFTASSLDLWQNLTFLGAIDYLKLILSEPKIILDHTNLVFQTFLESLPIIHLLSNVILLGLTIFVLRKVVKSLNFKFHLPFQMGAI